LTYPFMHSLTGESFLQELPASHGLSFPEFLSSRLTPGYFSFLLLFHVLNIAARIA